MSLWYLSFAGEEGWRGCCHVSGTDIVTATARAHELGINPGGEVRGWDLGDAPVPIEYRDILLDKRALEDLDRAMGSDGTLIQV